MLNSQISISNLKSIRDGFGEGLIEAGEKDKNVVVLTADLGESTRVEGFKEKFPDRFFEVGVAEQSLVTVAAGMALAGKIPFTTSYAVFSPGRTFEQIKITVAMQELPVKIVGAHAGFGAAPYGATHESLEDIVLMRVIPDMVVVAPGDFEEAKKATLAIAKSTVLTQDDLQKEMDRLRFMDAIQATLFYQRVKDFESIFELLHGDKVLSLKEAIKLKFIDGRFDRYEEFLYDKRLALAISRNESKRRP